jgi:TolB-like protein
VQRLEDRVRLTPRLADVHSGKLIWSDSLDTPAATTADGQKEIARRIAAQVQARLSR